MNTATATSGVAIDRKVINSNLKLKYALFALLTLALVGLLARALFSGLAAATIVSHPFQLDESEGMIVAETMLLDRGVGIYGNPTPDLFISTPYPPLFYLLNLPFQHLAGDAPTFKAGRTLSIFSTLVIGLALFGVVLRVTRDRLAAAIAATTWWSLGLITFWGSLVKPDMMAVALGVAGLWVLIARPPQQVWLALPLFVAAFYTKQTAIAAVAAAIAWLLLTRRVQTAIAFGASYAALVIIPTLLLNSLTDGGYFYHLLTIHDLPWFSERYLMHAGNLLSQYGLVFVPGTVVLIAGAAMWLRSRLRSELSSQHNALLLAALYLGASVVTASGAGTLGGNHNHLLDWSAASCLGLGLGIGLLRQSGNMLGLQLAGVMSLAMLAQLPLLWTTPSWLKLEYGHLSAEKLSGMSSIAQYVTNDPGEAYSDNVGLMLSAGKKLWTTDPYTQTHATLYGRWDERKLVEAIRAKNFSQIVLRIDTTRRDDSAGDVSPNILQAVQDSYKLDQRNVMFVYVPR